MGFLSLMDRLRTDTSGNALMLVAMGAPILFGTAGLSVDMAQYYTWKREAQYAVDQSALAGAWARGNGDDSFNQNPNAPFRTRSRQEFFANLSVTRDYLLTHTVNLANWADGTENSVMSTASVSASLPFTELVIGDGMTIAVQAQAIWQTNQQYTACLYALDPNSRRTMWFHGDLDVDAACGVGARSTAGEAISTGGNAGSQNINWVVAGGTIEDSAGIFDNAEVVENYADMIDPWEGLVPPDNTTERTIDCGSAEANWQADEVQLDAVTFKYYKGRNKTSAVLMDSYTGDGAKDPYNVTYPTTLEKLFTSEPVGYTQSPVVENRTQIAGSGPDKIFIERITTTQLNYFNIVELTTGNDLLPGTYEDFDLACDANLAGGVYVIDGGSLKLNAHVSLTGTGVMFVLKNGATVNINGGGSVYLTPMTKTQLIAAGVDAADADRMENMLIFQDPSTNPNRTTGNAINGGGTFDLNGIVYMPNAAMSLTGSMSASAECLMIATATLEISGGATLETLCPAGKVHDVVVGEGSTRVRLVL